MHSVSVNWLTLVMVDNHLFGKCDQTRWSINHQLITIKHIMNQIIAYL